MIQDTIYYEPLPDLLILTLASSRSLYAIKDLTLIVETCNSIGVTPSNVNGTRRT